MQIATVELQGDGRIKQKLLCFFYYLLINSFLKGLRNDWRTVTAADYHYIIFLNMYKILNPFFDLCTRWPFCNSRDKYCKKIKTRKKS